MLPRIPHPDKLPRNNELTVNVDILQTQFKSVSVEWGEEIEDKNAAEEDVSSEVLKSSVKVLRRGAGRAESQKVTKREQKVATYILQWFSCYFHLHSVFQIII